ncbi:MAG: acyl-CoA dehydrogenase family protein [Acidimicrobiaceae bacterium]|nr:acyl-CoA dehydrogenase family protein [Acidimicrobiaceae bacterium]
MISVDDFQLEARAWLAANRDGAPRDYGAICPPDLVEQGVAWHRKVHEAGFAGIHWPVEFGGRGLTPEHNSIWMLECAPPACRRCSTWWASCSPAVQSCASAPPSSKPILLGLPFQAAQFVVPAVQRTRRQRRPRAASSTKAERDGDASS